MRPLRFAIVRCAVVRCAVVTALVATPRLVSAESCKIENGAAVRALVGHGRDGPPATHPPCNAKNGRDLIESEIAQGCGLLNALGGAETGMRTTA